MTDRIDRGAGLSPQNALYGLRRLRPEFVEGAAACEASVLAPARDQGLSPDLRRALCRRMAMLNADAALAADYGLPDDPVMRRVAEGATDLPEPLAAIARHADRITRTPALASREDIAALEAAGLDNPQIVALSELIAFVNFQTRIAAGLRLMGGRT